MEQSDRLGARFDAERGRLAALAYRMLGSRDDAEDAVQESWMRLTRADHAAVENLGGWLTTVVSRVCLDELRSRRARDHEPLAAEDLDQRVEASPQADPEQEMLLAESVGTAMLVVLDTLEPGERVAFVLHDMFAVPFDQIGTILGRRGGRDPRRGRRRVLLPAGRRRRGRAGRRLPRSGLDARRPAARGRQLHLRRRQDHRHRPGRQPGAPQPV